MAKQQMVTHEELRKFIFDEIEPNQPYTDGDQYEHGWYDAQVEMARRLYAYLDGTFIAEERVSGCERRRASNEGNAWTTEPPTVDGFYWYRPTTDNPKQLARLVLVFSYRKQRDALTIDEDDGSTDSWSFENLCAEEPCEWKAIRP